MKHVEPEHGFRQINGPVRLDRKAVERLIYTATRHTGEGSSIQLTLEFKDGRQVVSSDLDDLEQFPFQAPSKRQFSIRVDGPTDQAITYTFTFGLALTTVVISAWRVANTTRAIEDTAVAAKSTRLWYEAFRPLVAIFSVSVVFSLFPLSLLFRPGGLAGLTAPEIGYLVFEGVWMLVVASRLLIWPEVVMMFGVEGERLRSRVAVARWILAAIGTVFVAAIGGGYFLATK